MNTKDSKMLAEKRAYLFGVMVVVNLEGGYLSPFFYLPKLTIKKYYEYRTNNKKILTTNNN